MINKYAIYFLTHALVVAAAACFDMTQGDIRLGGCQGSSQRRVGIAVDQHQVWPLSLDDFTGLVDDLSDLKAGLAGL